MTERELLAVRGEGLRRAVEPRELLGNERVDRFRGFWVLGGVLYVLGLSPEKSLSPATEKVPIMSTRMTQTKTATKIGTTRSKVVRSTTAFPRVSWFKIAIETPHHVNIAFIVAASNHAPNKYHTSVCGSSPPSGVNRRAMPAKSMLQKAIESMVAQRTPIKVKSPNNQSKQSLSCCS